jgi:hypothetical protein
MRWVRVVMVLVCGAVLSWTFAGETPVARAAAATKLLVHCCPDGVVGQPLTANIRPVDDNNRDDGGFTGTVTFSTDFTNDFTITPHDPGAGNRHKYTFKPGDLVNGGTAGKNFRVVFHEPGTGQFFATSPGLESIYDHPDSPGHSIRTNDFTIRPQQAGTTTTTTGGGGGSTTTSTTRGGGGGTTSTTARVTTTTAPSTTTTTAPPRVRPTTKPSIAVGGSPIHNETRMATALLLFGAVLVMIASQRRWSREIISPDEMTYSGALFVAIKRLHDRIDDTDD